ncbi:MAG: rRNA pseudouridine synthase [Oscillospiraceae bacterium]|nr:rRNA pseudouridine synthase [Oscillospiraceae bacterium]
MEKIRLQKIIAESGLCSRRKAEELIQQGKVKVNGHTAHIGDGATQRDIVTVDGERIRIAKKREKYYIMLNKPRGYVTTMSDELDRRCVTELLEDFPERVYPIGRLDRNSEGLLLFTNDGKFANDIMHPSRHVSKTYRVTVRPGVSDEQLVQLSEGVVIDGRKTLPATVNVLTQEQGRAVLQIVIREGRNRQIRKMCEAVGLEVARLKRTAIGPIRLGMLKPGTYRELTAEELRAIRSAIGDKI